jgi:hypothetical protein
MNQRAYGPIDGAIDEWAARHKFKLFTAFGGTPEARAVYLSSTRGECFQIWIDPPESGHVAVHAADVETRGDEAFREDWRVSVQSLPAALDRAVEHVHGWMGRP